MDISNNESGLTIDDFFCGDCLPGVKDIPFKDALEKVFYPLYPEKEDNFYLAIHCPNVIRFIDELFKDYAEFTQNQITSAKMGKIEEYLGITKNGKPNKAIKEKMIKLLRVAALYHDIGKKIRNDNHPRMGVNILLNYDDNERKKMIDALTMDDIEQPFLLLCSMVEHHDKFGVVSTGEASLAIFSDITYFRLDKDAPAGFNKTITLIMLLTLADIAAVCKAERGKKEDPEDNKPTQKNAARLINDIKKERPAISAGINYNDWLKKNKKYQALYTIWEKPTSQYGLSSEKVSNILEDWEELIKVAAKVNGTRTKLREELILLDQNPDRTIKRITRLIKECCYTAAKDSNLHSCISEADIEPILVSFFGVHQFQDFCVKFAYIVKMDYALNFFKGILCTCFREKTEYPDGAEWCKFSKSEISELIEDTKHPSKKEEILKRVVELFIQVISGIISRYDSILELKMKKAYRFGLQMNALARDENVREQILRYLCIEGKEHIALTWIADEVTFWAMD